MRKNVPILLICLLLCGCSKEENIAPLCLIDGCYNEAEKYSAYCSQHSVEDLQLEDEYNGIQLTETQLTECRAVVDEYCEKLMDTQSNIQAIYVPDDAPETSVLYIMYKCFVTRGDDMDIATIYVKMSDDETFEVYKMEYDK